MPTFLTTLEPAASACDGAGGGAAAVAAAGAGCFCAWGTGGGLRRRCCGGRRLIAAGNVEITLRAGLGRRSGGSGRRRRRFRCDLGLAFALGRLRGGFGLGALVGGLDLGRIVFGLFAGAAVHVGLAIFERDRKVHIGRAVQRDGLLDLLSGIAIDVELSRRRAARLALLLFLCQAAGISGETDRVEESVAEPHADRTIAPIRVDAAIDRGLGLLLFFLLLPAAEEVEQATAALRRAHLAAAAASRHCILKLGLPTLVAAAARERRALLLERGKLTARILDAVVHLEAFRTAHQRLAEDEEALEAAGVLHGRLGALEHAVVLGDLLVEAGDVVAAATAALRSRNQFLLELHAADLLLVSTLRDGKPCAGGGDHAAERERGDTASTQRMYGRGDHAPKTAIDPHNWFQSPGSHQRIMQG